MKIAVSGKGGVGKSTISAAVSLLLAKSGKRVLAVDADPDANLASALGIPQAEQDKTLPIARQVALIEERTGAKVNQYGQVFKLNPEVSDIPEDYSIKHEGVSLLVLGAVQRGGGGCACPENVFIRALVSDLILNKDDVLVMDMEAGIEHLGRATTDSMDAMIVVVEPGQMSVDCGLRVIKLAGDIGVQDIYLVANKVRDEDDKAFLRSAFPGREFLAFVPFLDQLRKADRDGVSVLQPLADGQAEVFENLVSVIESKAG